MDSEFEIERSRDGASWRVRLCLQPDRIQYIDGFETRVDAQGWIETQAHGWLKAIETPL